MLKKVPLTLGVEEEYQIIHPESRDLHSYVQQLMDRSQYVLPQGELKPEFMQSQVEVGSHVCRNVKEVRRELVRLRGSVGKLAEENGMKIVAASTHPFANWSTQDVTAGERYKKLLDHMQGVAEQLLIFGMHIHIGFGDAPGAKNLMIEIQNQLRYFLPHILALSTSSPFWQGRNTGLKSYRSVVFEMLPRTGIPESFESYGEYLDLVDLLGDVGSIYSDELRGPDASKIWWDVRPHPKFGTMEVRIADIATRIDDAVAIVALVQAIVAKLLQLRANNQSWRKYRRHHIIENKWRALRYGVNYKLIDFGRREEVPFNLLLGELLDLVEDVAIELGTLDEIQHLERMLTTGTSADRQVRTYEQALADGQSKDEALRAVVDMLAVETLAGT